MAITRDKWPSSSFVRSFVPFARVWIELESLYTIHKDLFLF
jgi:hypothetical protein